MKSTWLAAFVLAGGTSLAAQHVHPPTTAPAPQEPRADTSPSPQPSSGSTTTLTGCIAGTAGAFRFVDPKVVAGAGTIAPVAPVSASATPTPGAAGGDVAHASGSASVPGAVGTSGTIAAGSGSGDRSSGAAGTPGSGATTGTVTAPSTVPATPPIANITPDAGVLSTANGAMRGYRLTGADLGAWVGQPVRIVGTVVAAPAVTTNPASQSLPPTPALTEFRVQSVQAADGACP